jgi:outer membrane receptor protein involved in Fe transport
MRVNYAEGFRPSYLEACCSTQSDDIQGGSFGGNPNLDVERSRAVEGELNLVTLEDAGPIDKLYLRADYSYTQLSNIIEVRAGQYFSRGEQDVHSAEFLARLDFENRSTFSLAYYYLRAVDDRTGELRYPANHILNASLAYRILPWLTVSALLTAVGEREDLNRIPDLPNNQATMNAVVVRRLDSYYLLRAGLLVHDLPVNVLRDFELRIFGDNVLDQEYTTADPFFAEQLNPGETPAPRWSVFADLTYRLGASR